MYAYLKGTLAEVNSQSIALDVQGIGFLIHVPAPHLSRFPSIGNELKLFISSIIRENAHALYGFLTKEEKELFELLISISGIGPKSALSILSHVDYQTLQEAVFTGNARKLTEIPGIGKKTADRLILELKGKLPSVSSFSLPASHEKEAALALINLGYTQKMAEIAVTKALLNLPQEYDISLLIREAIKQAYRSN